MWSFWEQESFIGKPDLVVIGSGIVGLSAAIRYSQKYPERKISILEAGSLPSGASTKNAGFACYGSPSELVMDLSNESEEEVLLRIEKRIKGLANLKQLLGEQNIGYEQWGSYELFRHDDRAIYKQSLEQLIQLNELIRPILGSEAYHVKNEIIAQAGFEGIAHAIAIEGEGQINTGQMMKNLIRLAQQHNIQILNGFRVSSINSEVDKIIIQGSSGHIEASRCIIATNGFAQQLLPELNVKPARAQVLITKPVRDLKFKGTYHFDQGYYYFRNVGDRVLFGGGRNLDISGETTEEISLSSKIQSHLIDLLQTSILPDTPFEIEQQWAGIMGVGQTKETIVRQINENLVVSVRLGGMGIAIGSLIGREAAELLMQD